MLVSTTQRRTHKCVGDLPSRSTFVAAPIDLSSDSRYYRHIGIIAIRAVDEERIPIIDAGGLVFRVGHVASLPAGGGTGGMETRPESLPLSPLPAVVGAAAQVAVSAQSLVFAAIPQRRGRPLRAQRRRRTHSSRDCMFLPNIFGGAAKRNPLVDRIDTWRVIAAWSKATRDLGRAEASAPAPGRRGSRRGARTDVVLLPEASLYGLRVARSGLRPHTVRPGMTHRRPHRASPVSSRAKTPHPPLRPALVLRENGGALYNATVGFAADGSTSSRTGSAIRGCPNSGRRQAKSPAPTSSTSPACRSTIACCYDVHFLADAADTLKSATAICSSFRVRGSKAHSRPRRLRTLARQHRMAITAASWGPAPGVPGKAAQASSTPPARSSPA